MSFADVESEGERVPLELFSAQKLRKATDELSLLPKFPDFVLQLSIANWVLYKRDSKGDNFFLQFTIIFVKKCIHIFCYNFILFNFLVQTCLQYFKKKT